MPSVPSTDRGHARSRLVRTRLVPALPARVQAADTDRLLHGSHVTGADESDDVPSVPRCPVLIADDDPIMRALVRVILERDGYSVIEAKTGREAVALAGQHHPELIVLDLNMPQMDGCDAIATIRGTPALVATPIVVVTGEESPQVERQVLALGADDYIVKPFEPAVLSARVKAAFGR
jgi:CheY-like chemotaxis protein